MDQELADGSSGPTLTIHVLTVCGSLHTAYAYLEIMM